MKHLLTRRSEKSLCQITRLEIKTKTKENVDSVLTTLSATVNDIKESLSNDNSNELLKFLKEESAKQARRDEMFLNLMSAMVNNNQAQQGTNIPFLSSGYVSQSIRNLTEEPVPSTLVPSQQQNQRYLHSLGHSRNRYGLSRQTLSNVSRQNNNHVSFMDELNSDNIEYQ